MGPHPGIEAEGFLTAAARAGRFGAIPSEAHPSPSGIQAPRHRRLNALMPSERISTSGVAIPTGSAARIGRAVVLAELGQVE